jgi:hypothetical protein
MPEITPLVPVTFPPAPVLGELWTAQNGADYQWDGICWMGLPGQIASGLIGTTPFAPLGTEVISSTPTFLLPLTLTDIPTAATNFLVEGGGSGHIFARGIGPQLVTGTGGTFTVSLEYPFGSGVHVDIATLPFGATTFPADGVERIIRCNPIAGGANRVYLFDPLLNPVVTLGVRLTAGAPTGNPWNITLGLQGLLL